MKNLTELPRLSGPWACGMRSITSVNRDELPDGGAAVFAETIRQIRKVNPSVTIEVLIPDFRGVEWALDIVVDARPDMLNHNMETIPRLYPTVRPQAKYERSLELLDRAKQKGMTTKSGIMVGLGENEEEVLEGDERCPLGVVRYFHDRTIPAANEAAPSRRAVRPSR